MTDLTGIPESLWVRWQDTSTMSDQDVQRYGLINVLRAQGRFGWQWGQSSVAPLPTGKRKETINSFLRYIHRHCGDVTGWTDVLTIRDEVSTYGVLVMGYPKARNLNNDMTLEVNRLALMSGSPKNSASQLLGRAERIAKAKGYERLISYTLEPEEGHSYKAAGWTLDDHHTKSQQWDRKNRPRPTIDPDADIIIHDKKRWSKKI